MGARKRLMAEKFKEAKKNTAVAKLNDVPTSPRKMRLVADTVTFFISRRGSRPFVWRNFSVALSLTGKPRIQIRAKNWTTATSMSRQSWLVKVAHLRESVLALRAALEGSASVQITSPSFSTSRNQQQ